MYPLIDLLRHAKVDFSDYDIVNTRDLRLRDRVAPEWSVFYMKRGTCRCTIAGVDYNARAGDGLLIPPGVTHDIVKMSNDLATCLRWQALYTIGDSVDILRLFQLPVLFHVRDHSRLEDAFARYVSRAERPGTVADAIMEEAHAYEVMAVLLDEALHHSRAKISTRALAPLRRILLDVVQHWDRQLSLQDLAERYHLHPTYLSNRFRRAFGTSPIKLHLDARLSKAKELLLDDSLTVGEVGELVGYADLAQFSRFFHRRSGMSPREYRGRHDIAVDYPTPTAGGRAIEHTAPIDR